MLHNPDNCQSGRSGAEPTGNRSGQRTTRHRCFPRRRLSRSHYRPKPETTVKGATSWPTINPVSRPRVNLRWLLVYCGQSAGVSWELSSRRQAPNPSLICGLPGCLFDIATTTKLATGPRCALITRPPTSLLFLASVGPPLAQSVPDQKSFILTVLKDQRGNQCNAAKKLGVHRNTLRRTIRDLEIDIRPTRGKGRRRPPRSELPMPPPMLATGNLNYLRFRLRIWHNGVQHLQSQSTGGFLPPGMCFPKHLSNYLRFSDTFWHGSSLRSGWGGSPPLALPPSGYPPMGILNLDCCHS